MGSKITLEELNLPESYVYSSKMPFIYITFEPDFLVLRSHDIC